MNRGLFHLLVVSLLWLSADAAADSGALGHAHQGTAAGMEFAEASSYGADEQPDRDDSAHCERCCHAHASALPGLLQPSDTILGHHFPRPRDVARQASDPPPPIPPPIV